MILLRIIIFFLFLNNLNADEVLNDLGLKDPVLEIAKSLEKLALTDEYFVKRKLYPNA